MIETWQVQIRGKTNGFHVVWGRKNLNGIRLPTVYLPAPLRKKLGCTKSGKMTNMAYWAYSDIAHLARVMTAYCGFVVGELTDDTVTGLYTVDTSIDDPV